MRQQQKLNEPNAFINSIMNIAKILKLKKKIRNMDSHRTTAPSDGCDEKMEGIERRTENNEEIF